MKRESGLSVLMAVRDGAATLDAQFDAVARQLRADIDVVVVDDASTDDSLAIANAFAARTGATVLTERSPRGKPHALNRAAAAARADRLVVIDQDDVIGDGYLERMTEALEVHQLVFGRLEYHRLNPDWLAEALSKSPDQDSTSIRIGLGDSGSIVPVRVGCGCALGFQRRLFDRLAGFATDVGCTDDLDFCLRAYEAGVPLHTERTAVLHYRLRARMRPLFGQRMGYGESWAALYRKFRSASMPRPGLRRIAGEIGRATRQLLSGDPADRARGVAGLAFTLGRFRGSLKYHVRYFSWSES